MLAHKKWLASVVWLLSVMSAVGVVLFFGTALNIISMSHVIFISTLVGVSSMAVFGLVYVVLSAGICKFLADIIRNWMNMRGDLDPVRRQALRRFLAEMNVGVTEAFFVLLPYWVSIGLWILYLFHPVSLYLFISFLVPPAWQLLSTYGKLCWQREDIIASFVKETIKICVRNALMVVLAYYAFMAANHSVGVGLFVLHVVGASCLVLAVTLLCVLVWFVSDVSQGGLDILQDTTVPLRAVETEGGYLVSVPDTENSRVVSSSNDRNGQTETEEDEDKPDGELLSVHGTV